MSRFVHAKAGAVKKAGLDGVIRHNSATGTYDVTSPNACTSYAASFEVLFTGIAAADTGTRELPLLP